MSATTPGGGGVRIRNNNEEEEGSEQTRTGVSTSHRGPNSAAAPTGNRAEKASWRSKKLSIPISSSSSSSSPPPRSRKSEQQIVIAMTPRSVPLEEEVRIVDPSVEDADQKVQQNASEPNNNNNDYDDFDYSDVTKTTTTTPAFLPRRASNIMRQNRPITNQTFAAAERWNRVAASPPSLPSLSSPQWISTLPTHYPQDPQIIPRNSTSTTSTAATPSSPSVTSSKDEDVNHDMDYRTKHQISLNGLPVPVRHHLYQQQQQPQPETEMSPPWNRKSLPEDPTPTRLRVADVRSMFQQPTTTTIQTTFTTSRPPPQSFQLPQKKNPSSPPLQRRTTSTTSVSPVPRPASPVDMEKEEDLTNRLVSRSSPPLRRTSLNSVSPVPRISSPVGLARKDMTETNTTTTLESTHHDESSLSRHQRQDSSATYSVSTKPNDNATMKSMDSTCAIVRNHHNATTDKKNNSKAQSPPRPRRRTPSLERKELIMHAHPQSLVSKPRVENKTPAEWKRNVLEYPSSSTTLIAKPHTAQVETTTRWHRLKEEKVGEEAAVDAAAATTRSTRPHGPEVNNFFNKVETNEVRIEPPIPTKQQQQHLLPDEEVHHLANSMIETPPKLSVSAMKAKLWGCDAQKLKVPIQRTRLDCAPTSPIADLRRIFDTGSHVKSPLSPPPPPLRMQNNTRLSLSPHQRPSQHKTMHDDIDEPTRITPIPQDDDTIDEGYNRTESELNMIADRSSSIPPPSDYNHSSGHTTPSPVPPVVQPRLKHPLTQKPVFMSPPLQNNTRMNSPTASSKQRLEQKDSSGFERKAVAVTEDLNKQRMDRGEWTDHSSEIWAPLSDSFSEYDWINAALSRNKSGSSNDENNIAWKMEPTDDDSINHHDRLLTSPLSQRVPSSDDAISSIGPIDADDLYFSMNADAKQDNEKDPVFRRTLGWNSAIGIHKSHASAPKTPPFIKDYVIDPLDVDDDYTETTVEPTESRDLVELPNLFFNNDTIAPQKLVRPIPDRRSISKGVTEEPVEAGSEHGLWSFSANNPNLAAHSDSPYSNTRNINYPISIDSDEEIPDGICKTRAQSATASKVKAVEAVVSTHPITRCMLRLKWYLNGLFHRRINGVGVCRSVLAKKHFTYGQLLLLSPLLLFTAACTYTTFPNKSTSHSGNWAFYAVFYTFILAHKQASVFKVLGVSWDQLVPVHYAASVTAVILSIMHGYVAYTGHDYHPCREPGNFSLPELNDELPLCRDTRHYRKLGDLRLADNPRFRHSIIGTDPDLWKFLWDGGRNVSGTWMLICLLTLLVLSAFRWTLRRPCFDVWLALHIAAAGAILAFAPKHRVQLYIVLVIWWAFDGILRYGLGTLFRLPKTATLTLLTWKKQGRSIGKSGESSDCSIVGLSFNEKFHYKAGQYVRIAVVETGQPVMFHPMTISSAPYEDRVTIHFRPFGGWTRQLANMGARKGSARISSNIHVLLEGPYGLLPMNLWENPFRYPVVVLIAGGIGVTPIMSLARQLLYEHKHAGRERKIIRVVWAVKDVGLVEALPLLGQEIQEETEISSKFMVDPWRMLQRNKRRDGVIRDHPVPLFNDPVVTDFVSPSRKPTPLFDASIYVTSQKSDSDIVETNRMKDVVPFCSRDRRCGHRPGEADVDGMERGDMEAPLPKKTSRPSQGKSDAGCNYDDDRFSFFSGRPDIKFILNQTALSHVLVKDQRVAVIACGPQALVQDTKVACAQLKEYVRMDFHEELFLL